MTVTELATVLVEIVTVAKSDKALDLDALELYDHAFDRILPDQKDDWGPVMGRLRWIAVKNSPKNEELGLKCFKACLAKDDIEDAQQVCLSSSFQTQNILPSASPLLHIRSMKSSVQILEFDSDQTLLRLPIALIRTF